MLVTFSEDWMDRMLSPTNSDDMMRREKTTISHRVYRCCGQLSVGTNIYARNTA